MLPNHEMLNNHVDYLYATMNNQVVVVMIHLNNQVEPCVWLLLTQRLVAWVEHGRQAESQAIVGLHLELSDVLQPDGGALP